MKIFIYLTLFSAFSSFAFAEDKVQADPKKAEMMKKHMEYSTPGEEHKILADLAGNWNYTSRWWESPESKPEESKGSSKMKMILSGRFLQQDFKGKAMGQPFEGMGIIGYDKLKKEFNSIWLDSMGTGIMKAAGSYDQGTKTLSEKGQFTCPMNESGTAEYRAEWKMNDKNNTTYTMYSKGMTGEGPEFKTMEIIYKRK
ncbi:MAG TPA: DUF1579 domain-containing protein [Bacteriovoracaceae bacterium]|nr:DUF1579 domain-containing protein [Bacteriovoracaceae bacterium]